LSALLFTLTAAHSILDCPSLTLGNSKTTPEQEFANADCWSKTILAANNSDTDRVAWIPGNLTLVMMPISTGNLHDITLRIDGYVMASANWRQWPVRSQGENGEPGEYVNFWKIDSNTDLTIEGTGTIDGQGFMWWEREILQMNIHGRSPMVEISRTVNLEWSGVNLKNSMYYHLVPRNVVNSYYHDFNIEVDIVGQFELTKLFWDMNGKSSLSSLNDLSELMGHDLSIPLPTFPLNTDGIDFYGRNATFRRLNITSFDDTVVPKPSGKGSWGSDCTQDILVEDINVKYGVGMTIGSIAPSSNNNCIKNVIFRNIRFEKPLKGIYIKTNPGSGIGMVKNITYQDITMDTPIWWAIYIGPQQQKQPGGAGPGCMVYPLDPHCETQPFINITEIYLKNVTSTGGLLMAGILRCNETNPCVDFHFEDVSMKSLFWDIIGLGFITENIYGTAKNVFPLPEFLNPDGSKITDLAPGSSYPDKTDWVTMLASMIFMSSFLKENVGYFLD
jgi:hypothetical protein